MTPAPPTKGLFVKLLTKQNAAPLVFSAIAALALCGAFVLNTGGEHEPTPHRVSPPPAVATSVPPTIEATPDAGPPPEPPAPISASSILNVAVPAVGMSVTVSGKTEPRQTENCHASTVCIDPPVPDQAAWYGDVPSTPSVNPVLLFGHTSWSDPRYAAFNNLLSVMAGDTIVLTTETGIFTYTADAPVFVPYDKVAESQLIYGWETEKVVLVTCNTAEDSATVVVGRLVKVEAK